MTQDSYPLNTHGSRLVYTIELRVNGQSNQSAKVGSSESSDAEGTRRGPLTTNNAPLLAVVAVDDIEKAKRDRSCGCPIAVALARVFGRTALVAYETSWNEDGSRALIARATVERHSWTLPPHAVEFMRLFDQGREVIPITFELPEMHT